MSRITIDGLTLTEWCDYWKSGNQQFGYDDFQTVELRNELAEASKVVSRLMRMIDGVSVPEHGDATFDDVDGVNWFDLREDLTGKKRP